MLWESLSRSRPVGRKRGHAPPSGQKTCVTHNEYGLRSEDRRPLHLRSMKLSYAFWNRRMRRMPTTPIRPSPAQTAEGTGTIVEIESMDASKSSLP